MTWMASQPETAIVQDYTAEQWVAWCRLVIEHEAATLRRKYWKWQRDGVSYSPEEPGRTLTTESCCTDDSSDHMFRWVEWRLLLAAELNAAERGVLYDLYVNNVSQRQAAQHCGMSQAQISRVQHRACQKLREALMQ